MNLIKKSQEELQTASSRIHSIVQTYHANNLLPLWAADMDFLSLNSVKQAFEQYVSNGLFGYSVISNDLYQAVIDWEAE